MGWWRLGRNAEAAVDIPPPLIYSAPCITSGPAAAGLGNLGRTPKVPTRDGEDAVAPFWGRQISVRSGKPVS